MIFGIIIICLYLKSVLCALQPKCVGQVELIKIYEHILAQSAIEQQFQLILFLAKGQFRLSKWTLNCPQLFVCFSRENWKYYCISNHQINHFLTYYSLKWTPTDYLFPYTIQITNLDKYSTRRSILSTVVQIYDPSGFLPPTTFFAKCILTLMDSRNHVGWSCSWDHDL